MEIKKPLDEITCFSVRLSKLIISSLLNDVAAKLYQNENKKPSRERMKI